MAGKVQSVPRSQARAALAEAIATMAELQKEGRELAAARLTAMGGITAARAGVDAAQERLAGAKDAAVVQAVDAAMGRSADVTLTVPAARRAIIDAEDALEIARAALTGIDARIARNGTATFFANDAVKASAMIVLRDSPGLVDALAKAERAQCDMVHANATLQWLVAKGLVQNGGELVARFQYLAEPGLGRRPEIWTPIVQKHGSAGIAPWMAALGTLCTDADAPLPE